MADNQSELATLKAELAEIERQEELDRLKSELSSIETQEKAEQEGEVGFVEAGSRSLLEGLTFGHSEETLGLLASPFLSDQEEEQFEREQEAQRLAGEKKYGGLTLASEMVGTIVTGVAVGAGVIATGGALGVALPTAGLAGLGVGVGSAGVAGGVIASGKSRAEIGSERWQDDVMFGAVVGAATAPLGIAAGKAVAAAGGKLAQSESYAAAGALFKDHAGPWSKAALFGKLGPGAATAVRKKFGNLSKADQKGAKTFGIGHSAPVRPLTDMADELTDDVAGLTSREILERAKVIKPLDQSAVEQASKKAAIEAREAFKAQLKSQRPRRFIEKSEASEAAELAIKEADEAANQVAREAAERSEQALNAARGEIANLEKNFFTRATQRGSSIDDFNSPLSDTVEKEMFKTSLRKLRRSGNREQKLAAKEKLDELELDELDFLKMVGADPKAALRGDFGKEAQEYIGRQYGKARKQKTADHKAVQAEKEALGMEMEEAAQKEADSVLRSEFQKFLDKFTYDEALKSVFRFEPLKATAQAAGATVRLGVPEAGRTGRRIAGETVGVPAVAASLSTPQGRR